MVIIVPNKVDGLNNLIQDLNYFSGKSFAKYGQISEVELYLPKFKIESTIPLKDVLKDVSSSLI